jgi:hypothetical protein
MGDLLLPLAVGLVAALVSLVAWHAATAERRGPARRPSEPGEDELSAESGMTADGRATRPFVHRRGRWWRIGAVLRLGRPGAPRVALSEPEPDRPTLLRVAFDRAVAWLTGPEDRDLDASDAQARRRPDRPPSPSWPPRPVSDVGDSDWWRSSGRDCPDCESSRARRARYCSSCGRRLSRASGQP